MTRDSWHMTCDRWHVTGDRWNMTIAKWHIVWDEHSLKFQLPSSSGLGLAVFEISLLDGAVDLYSKIWQHITTVSFVSAFIIVSIGKPKNVLRVFLDVLGLFWTFLDVLGQIEAFRHFYLVFWHVLVCCGMFWDIISSFGTFWDILWRFGMFWDVLAKSRQK